MVTASYDPGQDYDHRLPRLRDLDGEVQYALAQALASARVKIHSLPHRVKKRQDAIDKMERKGYASLEECDDLVGIRIVCLFLSDIERAIEVVRTTFNVLSESDTIELADQSRFGYMSFHCTARLPPDFAGPRYDALRDLRFEIQVRTILMDAWANVSHYLDYKGDASIPDHLRRDFFALSGLFYVADKHFELFFDETRRSRAATADRISGESDPLSEPLDLDTMLAYLRRQLPDREHAEARAVAELVEELSAAGYRTLRDVDDRLARSTRAFAQSELENPPHARAGYDKDSDQRTADVRINEGLVGADGADDDEEWDGRYNDVGVVRISLAIADPEYSALKYQDDDQYARHRHLLD